MPLFQFGFSISSTRQQTPHAPENIALAASHLPDQEDTILGIFGNVWKSSEHLQ